MYSIIKCTQSVRLARFCLSIACLNAIFIMPASAFDPDSKAPIEIESDQATLDDKSGTSTYTGNVIVSQGLSKLAAETIIVISEDRKIISISATGTPAHFTQQTDKFSPSTHGYGKEITYSTKDETLLFKGNAKLIQSENSFSGETIEYDVVKKAIKAKGNISEGSRVKIQYYPESSNKSSSEQSAENTQTDTASPSTDNQ